MLTIRCRPAVAAKVKTPAALKTINNRLRHLHDYTNTGSLEVSKKSLVGLD